MRQRLPACSLFRQDIRHHPETADYKSCRAANRVFVQHLSEGLTTLLRAKVQLSGALQATGAVCNPTPSPKANIITELPWKENQSHSGVKREEWHRWEGLLCDHGLSNRGTSIIPQLWVLHCER